MRYGTFEKQTKKSDNIWVTYKKELFGNAKAEWFQEYVAGNRFSTVIKESTRMLLNAVELLFNINFL